MTRTTYSTSTTTSALAPDPAGSAAAQGQLTGGRSSLDRNSTEGEIMGSIKSSLFISLDGVIERPRRGTSAISTTRWGRSSRADGGSDATLLGRRPTTSAPATGRTLTQRPDYRQMNGSRKYWCRPRSPTRLGNSPSSAATSRPSWPKLKQDKTSHHRQRDPGPLAARGG